MIIKYINNIEFLNLKLGNVSLTILVRGLHIFIWTTLHIFYLYTFFYHNRLTVIFLSVLLVSKFHLHINLFFKKMLPEELFSY